MFCTECGGQVKEGSKFCPECGTAVEQPESTPASAPPGTAAVSTGSPPAAGGEIGARRGGAFLSPAVIALAAILALLVVAGLAVGVFFLFRGGSEADAATIAVWEEYEEILEEDGEGLASIQYDPEALVANREALEASKAKVQELEGQLARTAGTPAWRADPGAAASVRDAKAKELAEALAEYVTYIEKLHTALGAIADAIASGSLHSQEVADFLNGLLAEAQEQAEVVAELLDAFRANNSAVAAGKFNPAVLEVAGAMAGSLAKQVAAAQEAEKAAAEQAAAEQAAAEEAAAAAAEAERRRQAAEAPKQPSRFRMTDYDGSPFYCTSCGSQWGVMRNVGYGPARFCADCGQALHN